MGWPDLNLFGEKFAYGDPRSYDWTGLKDGDHYFALFYKAGGFFGQWYAPLYAKVTLPGTVETGVSYARVNSVNISSTMEEWLYDIDPINPLNIDGGNWAIVYFDIPDNVSISYAEINLLIGGIANEITFAPLDSMLPHAETWKKWDRLVDNSIVDESKAMTFPGPIGNNYIITEVVRAAALTSQKAILIRTNDTGANITLNNDASAPWIFADIIK